MGRVIGLPGVLFVGGFAFWFLVLVSRSGKSSRKQDLVGGSLS